MLMRSLIPFLLCSASAHAAPCEVSIPRAPDDVKLAIEDSVNAELRCGSPLEVRVVPSDGGYYLFARDASGRVRERVVPDAQSAGVLVASWMADDGTPEPASTVIEVAPPATVVIESGIATRAVAKPRSRAPWLAVGALQRASAGGGRGVRAELDLKTSGRWSVGVALSGADSNLAPEIDARGGNFVPASSFTTMHTRDIAALATVARTMRADVFELRIGGGVGLVHSSADGSALGSGEFHTRQLAPIGELSVQASVRLGRRWAISAGPVVTWFVRPDTETLLVDDPFVGDSTAMPIAVTRNERDVSLFAAVRKKL
jgi:hypothetical protein